MTKIDKIERVLVEMICAGGGDSETITKTAKKIARIMEPKAPAPFRCQGCGRPEDDCSADPCADVIEDREA